MKLIRTGSFMNYTETPVIEKVKVEEVTIRLRAKMTLASVAVTVSGQYNIHSNCYYPSTIQQDDTEEFVDLEDYCNIMRWDYYDTFNEIQEAVEKRDR